MSQGSAQDRIQSLLRLAHNPTGLVSELKKADSDTLYAFVSQTGSTGLTGAEYEAARQTAVAILQARLTDSLLTTMERLNRSATILYWVGIAVALIIGVAQILVPLFVRQ